MKCKRHFFLRYSVFYLFTFLIALSLPLALECIYKLILTCFEQLWVSSRHPWAHLMWCTNRWTEYLSLMLYYILRMNFCTPVSTDPSHFLNKKKKSVWVLCLYIILCTNLELFGNTDLTQCRHVHLFQILFCFWIMFLREYRSVTPLLKDKI